MQSWRKAKTSKQKNKKMDGTGRQHKRKTTEQDLIANVVVAVDFSSLARSFGDSSTIHDSTPAPFCFFLV